MGSKTFKQVFDDALDAIEADAKAHGINLTQICAATGISRATPSRWKVKPPKTIKLVTVLQQELERAKQEKVKAERGRIPGEDY